MAVAIFIGFLGKMRLRGCATNHNPGTIRDRNQMKKKKKRLLHLVSKTILGRVANSDSRSKALVFEREAETVWRMGGSCVAVEALRGEGVLESAVMAGWRAD